MQGKKVYIAGKVTGDKDYKSKFENAAQRLIADGLLVMSPAILPEGFDYEDYMTVCFAMIDVCDTVVFLPDWKESRGAMREYEHAIVTFKKILYLQKDKAIPFCS